MGSVVRTMLASSKMMIVQPIKEHTATLIFFHGSGDSGNGIKKWIDVLNRKELRFSHIKIIYPTALSQPYTPLHGMISNVWFDRDAIHKNSSENAHSIDGMCKIISDLIDDEIKNGIPLERMVVGGFSMGGALAMHLAYRFKPEMAGCVVMSSFLNENSLVYKTLNESGGNNKPPLLQFHGLQDTLVPPEWGNEMHHTMSYLNVQTEYIELRGVEHELVTPEIQKLVQWINIMLPES